jgi:hypothetical protein
MRYVPVFPRAAAVAHLGNRVFRSGEVAAWTTGS